MVVEGDARADHIKKRRTLVSKSGFKKSDHLPGIACEGAAYKVAAEFDSQGANVDGGKVVDDSAFCFRAQVRSCRELSPGQAVHAVVLYDVDHWNIAPQQVNELTHTDRSRVAVATDADGN